MKQVIFATGNADKFATALAVCARHGIVVEQRNVNVLEIQSEDSKVIALDKATKAYELLHQPVVISDDSWAYLGLRGFPGAYMHSINEWFTPEDFLRLTSTLADRRVVLTRYVVYQDRDVQMVFTDQVEGELLREIRGNTMYANHTITTLAGDNGLSIAEVHDRNVDTATRRSVAIWQDFATWFRDYRLPEAH